MPGPFFFAWADATETTFGPEHQVEDEEVFSFRVEHAEGEFARLSIDIKNPRIGLLAPARKTWAWLSWNNGTEVIPLFFGRLVGVPSDLHQEIVTLDSPRGRPITMRKSRRWPRRSRSRRSGTRSGSIPTSAMIPTSCWRRDRSSGTSTA